MSTQTIRAQMWILPVSLIALIAGILISLSSASRANLQSVMNRLTSQQQALLQSGELDLEEYTKVQAELEKARNELDNLRQENTKLQNAVAENTDASMALNNSLQELKVFAGLTELEGEGLALTLRDSEQPSNDIFAEQGTIHDFDILRFVNELYNAGAEAVSVNGRRVGPNTNFRCVGSTILMDEVKIAPPIKIYAIGDSATLNGALNLPGGLAEELRMIDPYMVSMRPMESLRIPAYQGPTTKAHAKVPEEVPEEAEEAS